MKAASNIFPAADSASTYVSRRHNLLIQLTPACRDASSLSRNGLGCIGVLSPTRPHFSRVQFHTPRNENSWVWADK